MQMKNILVLGSCNIDFVIRTEDFPAPGQTLLGEDFAMINGGKGANQAVAAARLGGDVTFITNLGRDIFGTQALEALEKENINLSFVNFDEENPTGMALITLNKKGENTIVVAPGANNHISKVNSEHIDRAADEAEFILLQLETDIDFIDQFIRENSASKKIILNPAPAKKLASDLFEHLYMITPNQNEAELLTGVSIVDDRTAFMAAEKLRQKGVKNVIITLGSKGALCLNDEEKFVIAAPKVDVVDTTAAGDTFNGALVVALAQNCTLKDAMKFAGKAASISVTRKGAQSSIPYLKEIESVYI